jgi:hypothetical protein
METNDQMAGFQSLTVSQRSHLMARIISFMIKNIQLATFLLRYVGMITMTRALQSDRYLGKFSDRLES